MEEFEAVNSETRINRFILMNETVIKNSKMSEYLIKGAFKNVIQNKGFSFTFNVS